ncbi:hypothetical protein [Pacificoceanicola onchidii]|uniref:hypothetical protein n=1 Tax=Pacificoceanicola onchidii TaxID=2562685 RepID=UPI0010A63AE8|nr:hypothetical protein [Pacificoceanicola onchidii]
MAQIFVNIPLWVYPLFIVLILLGLRACKDRLTPVWVLYLMPLLGLLSVNRALSLGPVALGLLLLAACAGVWVGLHLQPRWTVRREGARVHLRGERLTLVTLLVLFCANFIAGAGQSIAPEVTAGLAFGFGWGVPVGLLSGSLLGRALSVARLPM